MSSRLILLFYLFSVVFLFSQEALSVTAENSNGAAIAEDAEPASSATIEMSPAKNLEYLQVLELSEGEFNWRRDWWKYLIMLLAFLLALCLIFYLVNTIFRVLALLLCLCSAFAGAFYFDALFCPWLPESLPDKIVDLCGSVLVCRLAGAVTAYLLAALMVSFILKLIAKKPKNG